MLCLSAGRAREPHRLPTGVVLDPPGRRHRARLDAGDDGVRPTRAASWSSLSGYREQGIQVIDRASRRVVQTIDAAALRSWARASRPMAARCYVSGGNRDVVYALRLERRFGGARWTASRSGPPPDSTGGRAYPAGLACSPDGARLYVAENLADSLAVVDPHVAARDRSALPTGRYPYGIVVDGTDGKVYRLGLGSARGSPRSPAAGPGHSSPGRRIAVGRHPRRWCSITLSTSGST